MKLTSIGRSAALETKPIHWKGRDATRLTNGLVELIALTDGGHLAEFRFLEQNGFPSENVLWEAPWITVGSNRLEELSQTAGFTGHALCLDYFGAPSPEGAEAGLPIHGEAGAKRWNVHGTFDRESAACQWNVKLPVAQLEFERKMHLSSQESVVYVEETVKNEGDTYHPCQWVQHATFAPPFLNSAESSLVASATRGLTSPLKYEGGSLLAVDQEFSWPHAPRECAAWVTVDLRRPFSAKGLGFSAAVQLDTGCKTEFLLAMNWKLRLGVGYCFRREDFPWMSIWEENCTRLDKPWNGNTQARGMEFGTTPFPVGSAETIRRGNIFDTPTWCVVPAHGKRTARYLMFLFVIPAGMESIQNAEVEGDAIILYDEPANSSFSIPAYGCEDFLGLDNKQAQAGSSGS
jgi:hypothetical protein